MRLAVTCYLVPCIYGYAISQRRLPSDSAGLDQSTPATGYNSPQSRIYMNESSWGFHCRSNSTLTLTSHESPSKKMAPSN
ncbi:hypothetical protein EV363DRAFT_126224 [Boletus edulis]|nr:hypothetical protein EV363DRAFT_126224 [Boletus edulis]